MYVSAYTGGTSMGFVAGSKDMAKTKVDAEYHRMLGKFADRYAKAQSKGAESEAKAVSAFVEQGRRYDKIVRMSATSASEGNVTVAFFVDRENGDIFGPKSEQAPNIKRYFGTIYNADKWDWSGKSPVNVSDETVEETGAYGDVKHYAKRETAKV